MLPSQPDVVHNTEYDQDQQAQPRWVERRQHRQTIQRKGRHEYHAAQ